MATRDVNVHDAERVTPWWVLLVATMAWLVLWYFTPGLHTQGLGVFVTGQTAPIVLETLAALALLVVVGVFHHRVNRPLFAQSKQVWLYLLPLASGLVLPVHYTQSLPLWVYMSWMTVSVIWQDYLTFGLLQSYLSERLSPWATAALVAIVFWAGHAVLVPDRFASGHWLATLGIAAMGLVFALVRARLASLHVLLAAHLSFYFIFA